MVTRAKMNRNMKKRYLSEESDEDKSYRKHKEDENKTKREHGEKTVTRAKEEEKKRNLKRALSKDENKS